MPERSKEHKREWACRVEITRASRPAIEIAGRGVDALQALVNAFAAARHALKDDLRELTWLGDPGHIGIPRIVPDDDPDFLELFEHLLLAERCRVLLAGKRVAREAGRLSRGRARRTSR
ncbi:MAG: hypothetical protein HS104_00025 [Polyangiaceae bacterium]|nr:hypothetical protein [Polyangiaceae bacterium]MBK8996506.1 hypothetical protein [Myxococcales bacterium]